MFIEDDWEQGHEELSKITETSRGWNDVNHNQDINDQDDLRVSNLFYYATTPVPYPVW